MLFLLLVVPEQLLEPWESEALKSGTGLGLEEHLWGCGGSNLSLVHTLSFPVVWRERFQHALDVKCCLSGTPSSAVTDLKKFHQGLRTRYANSVTAKRCYWGVIIKKYASVRNRKHVAGAGKHLFWSHIPKGSPSCGSAASVLGGLPCRMRQPGSGSLAGEALTWVCFCAFSPAPCSCT